jgi:formylglycine-generating enzyme required for sulfatase activity
MGWGLAPTREEAPLSLIPAGSFWMGSPPHELGRNEDEPLREAEVAQPFLIQRVPLTQALWREVYQKTQKTRGFDMARGSFNFRGLDRPADSLSWFDAVMFANLLSELDALPPAYHSPSAAGTLGAVWDYCAPRLVAPRLGGWRLPSEAEWEYAARAGSSGPVYATAHAGGQRAPWLEEVAWYDSNSSRQTQPVAQKQPNLWGLYDMLGNVWEWCEVSDPGLARLMPPPEAEDDAPDPAVDANLRPARGGSWLNQAQRARCAVRETHAPRWRYRDQGLRLVRCVAPLEVLAGRVKGWEPPTEAAGVMPLVQASAGGAPRSAPRRRRSTQ